MSKVSAKGTSTLLSYGDFSDEDRKRMEETGMKQEFQAEVFCKYHSIISGESVLNTPKIDILG